MSQAGPITTSAVPDRIRTRSWYGRFRSGAVALALVCATRLAPASPPPRTPVDAFIQEALQHAGIPASPEADRTTLVRRVAFTLTGLPPTPDEIDAFVGDQAPDAYERMVERFLASPHHGIRWARHWLDAAGYADSNGYFNADTDRPLAFRYRDYVVRSINRDLPFDRFLREQLAGDELSGWKPGQPASPEIVELLEATHFLRNGQDGSGESDGNPDEVRADRYYALESALQIVGTSLLGVTVQCAKCHDHKFEPFTQRDYYALQAFLYPAFHIEKWTKPNDRVAKAPLPGELEAWQDAEKRIRDGIEAAQAAFRDWSRLHRPPGRTLFSDTFEPGALLAPRWSSTAPGDDAPGGSPPVTPDSDKAPGAAAHAGQLRLAEGGGAGDRWLCTRDAFDWQPATVGGWIQATFDLVDDRIDPSGTRAERIGYFIAAHDFDDSGPVPGGNILVDGNPGGASVVEIDYPGKDSSRPGRIGATAYKPGRNYGVRVTRLAADRFRLEHLVDGGVDGNGLELRAADLPRGAFGFEYCCGRSFVVDNVRIEASNESDPAWAGRSAGFEKELAARRTDLDRSLKELESRRTPEPGRIAWTTDSGPEAPPVPLLKRGNHKTPGEPVPPAFPAFLAGPGSEARPTPTATTTGRRRALAEWLTRPDSPQATLVARVTANRVWQHHFGTGIVATPDNLGRSGAAPTHPGLLDWLAAEFIRSGWSLKALHRQIVLSHAFRQSSLPRPHGLERDPSDRLLWRYPVRRLDADALRDAMLSTSGRLGTKQSGPYVPTPRDGGGEVGPDESRPEAFARTLFLQQRRTQVPTFLSTFDAPSVVFNCTRRASTTMPLQSLAQLNSGFAIARAADLAARLAREEPVEERRLTLAFRLVIGRPPNGAEREAATAFLENQTLAYTGRTDARRLAWNDLCQSLYALNAFLYVE